MTDTDRIAVRVTHASKIYELWDSPRDRLIYPLKRAARSLLPSSFRPAGHDLSARGCREFHALHDISFEIRKGESWGFIGVNGSGKSTLLKMISGNLRPSTGTLEVDGKVAILDYGSGFSGDFTGRENVYLKGSLLGLNRKEMDKRFQSIAEFADIGQFMDQPVKTYSSGMTARLGFAIMAHVDADILITDEALAVGDAFFVQKCMRHIRTFLSKGTFLFVSHSTNDVMSLCDNAIWLNQGRVIRIGKAGEVCQAYLSSVDKRNSEEFLAEAPPAGMVSASDRSVETFPDDGADKAGGTARVAAKQIRMTGEQLALLKNHFSPPSFAEGAYQGRQASVAVVEAPIAMDYALAGDGAVGGGKIFNVTLTDEAGRRLVSVLGGDDVCLAVSAVADQPIRRPIIGFQLKNNLGLSLIAENTYLATQGQEIGLQPAEVITARFRFRMPLVPVGDYVFRVGFADGVEDNNALIDVQHEALLLRCETSGARHGLVGIPMIEIGVTREPVPQQVVAGEKK